MLVCAFLCASMHTRPRVQRAPGLPCALFFLGAELFANLGRIVSRECGPTSRRPRARAGVSGERTQVIQMTQVACLKSRVPAKATNAITASTCSDSRIFSPDTPARSRGRRNMGSRSRDTLRPSFANSFAPKKRGRREDRVRAAPEVSCAMCIKQSAHEHTGEAETLRPSLRNGLTTYTCSPW